MSVAVTRAGRALPANTEAERLSPWQVWGFILIAPYVLIFLTFVLYPVGYGLWVARRPQSYVALFEDPIFLRSVVNTLIFLVIGVNLKMIVALLLSGVFVQARPWIRWLSLIFAILVHIWKSLPFWTLILIAGRLAIAADLYEAASVDGANDWQKFRFVTWPSMQTLYLTCTILSMIWTLGDFNSVYLLTGGGPADLTHVLATLGIRYLRLDQVDMSMAAIVCALPLVLPLVYFMMKRLSK